MFVVGAQANRGEERLAEGDGRGVRLQTLPLRTGRREGNAAERGRQSSHRYEVRELKANSRTRKHVHGQSNAMLHV